MLFAPPISRYLDGDGSGLLGGHTLGPALVFFLGQVIPGAKYRVGGLFLLTRQIDAQLLDQHHDCRRDGECEERAEHGSASEAT
jgi:hypothetical protein